MCFPSCLRQVVLAGLVLSGLLQTRADVGVSLLNENQPGLGWVFENGQEFAGATGQLTEVPGKSDSDPAGLRLAGDFSGGGSYVQMLRELPVRDVEKIVLKVRSENTPALVVRLNDETGQCHQRAISIRLGEWQEVELTPSEIAGAEHWGGADDGVWHGAPTKMAILIMNKPEEPQPVVDFAEIHSVPVK